jgi:hypothetical protein
MDLNVPWKYYILKKMHVLSALMHTLIASLAFFASDFM